MQNENIICDIFCSVQTQHIRRVLYPMPARCVWVPSMFLQLWHILVVSLVRIIISRSKQNTFGHTFAAPCSIPFRVLPISVTNCEWILCIYPQQKRMIRNRKWLYFNRHWIFSTIFSLLQFRLSSAHVVWMWWLIFQKMETTKMYATDSESDSRTLTNSRLLAIFVRLYIMNTKKRRILCIDSFSKSYLSI